MDPYVESWGEILGPQALDLALLTGFLALSLVSFFRKSVRLKYVTFVAAVAYMGFAKSRLVSVVDMFAVADLSLPIFKYSLNSYLLWIFVLGSTVLCGRLYCGRICAYGALTQLMDPIIPRRWRFEVPLKVERYANWIKYGLLAAVLAYFLVTRDVSFYVWVEPFWMFGMFGTAAMWIGPRRPAGGDGLRAKPVLPVSLPGRRDARHPLEPDGVPHQALGRVQQLQDLREDVRVGRDPRAEDHRERMRALRRLRASLPRSEEVPALDHPQAEGQHVRVLPRAVSRDSGFGISGYQWSVLRDQPSPVP